MVTSPLICGQRRGPLFSREQYPDSPPPANTSLPTPQLAEYNEPDHHPFVPSSQDLPELIQLMKGECPFLFAYSLHVQKTQNQS